MIWLAMWNDEGQCAVPEARSLNAAILNRSCFIFHAGPFWLVHDCIRAKKPVCPITDACPECMAFHTHTPSVSLSLSFCNFTHAMIY